jgi:[ribosomal protein S18]-alanine N-acetyltransferase
MTPKTRLVKQSEIPILVDLDIKSSLTPWSLDNYISSFNNKNHKIYVLEVSGQIIGAIVLGLVSDEAEILQVWIKKSEQNKGYAQILFKQVFKYCNESNVQDVFLEVRSDNINAIVLYKKLGFINVGTRPDYYLIDGWKFDAIIMLKKLECYNIAK